MYLILVSFFIYLSPSVLTSSILIVFFLYPLKTDSNFLLVKGEGLGLGTVGDMMVFAGKKSHNMKIKITYILGNK